LEGESFTTGIILPGQYKFSTEKVEHISVTLGALQIKVPGEEWKKISRGETAIVPRGVEFQLKADKTVAYLCFFK